MIGLGIGDFMGLFFCKPYTGVYTFFMAEQVSFSASDLIIPSQPI